MATGHYGIKLVETFSELTTGMKVLEIGCDGCGKSHVFELGRLLKLTHVWKHPEEPPLGIESAFVVAPMPSHTTFGWAAVVSESMVKSRRVFRFLDLTGAVADIIAEHDRRAREAVK